MQKEYIGGIVTFGVGLVVILLIPSWRGIGAGIALGGLALVARVIWKARAK